MFNKQSFNIDKLDLEISLILDVKELIRLLSLEGNLLLKLTNFNRSRLPKDYYNIRPNPNYYKENYLLYQQKL